MRLSCIFLPCIAAILRTSSALIIEGDITSTNSFQLIGRFCFTKTDDAAGILGNVEYTFDFPVTKTGAIDSLGLLLFYEGVTEFYGAWQNEKSCVEKWNYAAGRHHERTGIDNTFPLHWKHKLKYITNAANETTHVRYTSEVPFKTSRPRFFFVILANCNPQKCAKNKAVVAGAKKSPPNKELVPEGLCEGPLTGIHYKLKMENVGVRPGFLSPFSWDEDWNPITSYVLLGLQLGLAIMCFYATLELNKMHKFHHSVSILNAAVMAQFGGMIMYSIGYSVFMVEGRVYQVHTTNAIIGMFLSLFCCVIISVLIGIICHVHPVSQALIGMLNWPWITFAIASLLEIGTSSWIFQTDDPISIQLTDIFSYAGRMYTFMSDFTFLLVVMILAHGWTIVRRKLSAQARFRLVVIVSLYWCTLIACIIWNEVSWNMATSFSIWETVPGYCILAARMFIYLWFVYTTGATLLRFNRQKKAFYGLFFCVYSVWLVALPITCLVSSQLLPRSYQNKVLFLVNNLVTLIAQGILAFLYVPGIKITQKIFPFHATYEQMDIMNTFHENTHLDSDEEKVGDGGGKHIMDGVLGDKAVDKIMKVQKDLFKGTEDKSQTDKSKLVPTNSKNKKRGGGSRKKNRTKRIVSSVLTDNPTHRIDYRLDSVIFRLDRLFTTVFATHRIVQRMISVSPPKKSSEAKDDNGEERKVAEDTSATRSSRPITSSTSAAASRWKSARGIRSKSTGIRAMRDSVDNHNTEIMESNSSRRRSRRPRRSRNDPDRNVPDDEAKSNAPEESKSEAREQPAEEEPTSRRARRPRRQRTVATEAAAAADDEANANESFRVKKERTPEEEAERRERKRRKKEKRKKRKERRARRERKKRGGDE